MTAGVRCLLWALLLGLAPTLRAAPLPSEVSLAVGETLLLMADVRRAALGSGKVVSMATPELGQLLLFGENPGVTTAQLWLKEGGHAAIRITVRERDLSARLTEVQALLPDTGTVTARVSGRHIVLEGRRASAEEQARAQEVAALFPGEVLDFVGGAEWESMVQMQVRLVEVRRDQLRSLGLRWDSETAGPAATLQGGAGRGAIALRASIASALGSRIDLLQQQGLAHTLAEPTLSCRSGGTARFVSGGEVPIPVVDGLGATDVQYKEYGVILEVRPRADRSGAIYAELDIELSQLDAAVRVGDFPGFLKRRTSTAINAEEGETVAIAGLVTRESSGDRSGVPGFSRVPGLGALFRSDRRQRRDTELLVLITARRFDAGVRAEAGAEVDQGALIRRGDELRRAGETP